MEWTERMAWMALTAWLVLRVIAGHLANKVNVALAVNKARQDETA